MRIDILTIFPEMITGFATQSLLGRAQERRVLDVRTHDIRDYATDNHRTVDGTPFGGGAGMVLKPEPVVACIEATDPPRPLYYLGPGGDRLTQERAAALAASDGFSLLCGRYEGVDQRIIDHFCDGALSIGDYVLAGGEVAALVIVEAVGRLVPGVMGNEASADDESFASGLLEYPHYTRPASFRGHDVPEVLRSGDHARVQRWRAAQSLLATAQHRPDLLRDRPLNDLDRATLAEFGQLDEVLGLVDGA